MSEQKPAISVIIPVRNEEDFLPKCLDSLQNAADYAQIKIEIIIVLNRSSDRSEEIALARGCRVVKIEAKNLSIIRNAGVAAAQAEIITTIDADNIASQNLFAEILKDLNSKKYIGGGTWIIPERWSLGILVSFLGLLPFLLTWRISVGIFYCFKKDFDAITGFNPEYFSAEDVEFARRLKKYGKQQGKAYRLFPKSYIITSCRKFDRFGDWYFVSNIFSMLKLLKGKKSAAADEIWYEFNNKN